MDGTVEYVFSQRFHSHRAAFETTPVEFTPAAPGSYEFTCGMGMVRGRLIVEAAR